MDFALFTLDNMPQMGIIALYVSPESLISTFDSHPQEVLRQPKNLLQRSKLKLENQVANKIESRLIDELSHKVANTLPPKRDSQMDNHSDNLALSLIDEEEFSLN